MPSYFTAGEFAKIHGVSKQTILFYDKIGLLSPSYTDPSNQYRYYDSTQLEILDTIFILKEIGIPLKEIKSYLQSRTTVQAVEMLTRQKECLAMQIADKQKIYRRLCARLAILREAGKAPYSTRVEFLPCESQYLYAEKVSAPFTLLEVDIGTKKLLKNLTQKRYDYNYQIGVILPKEYLETKNYLCAEYVFSILSTPVSDEHMLIKPEGWYAVAYHHGAYGAAGDTYEKIMAAISSEGFVLDGASYEECLIDTLAADSPSEYVTKISIAVKKSAS